jgi:2-keto-3-deoxy-L-rhamnonate aldolase RhmA
MSWFDIRQGSSLRRSLVDGRPIIGCFIRIPAPEVIEACAYSGFGFVVIDTEHTLANPGTVADLVRAAQAAGIVPLIRSLSTSSEEIGRLLETGAIGVHVPRVESAAQAAAAVRAVKYPPAGSRGLATGRGTGYGLQMSLADYVEAANRESVVVVQVESANAINNVESIAAVAGVDVLFVGLTDLSLDLGVPAQYDHPKVVQSLDQVLQVARSAGLTVGVPVASAGMARQALQQGVQYIVANDIRVLTDGMGTFLAQCAERPT